jgi:hypothetical protein
MGVNRCGDDGTIDTMPGTVMIEHQERVTETRR